MATLVVTLFLPWSPDFHEFDIVLEASLKRVPSNQSVSAQSLDSLERRNSSMSLLGMDLEDTDHHPDSDHATLTQRLTNLKLGDGSSKTPNSSKRNSWAQTESAGVNRLDGEMLKETSQGLGNFVDSNFLFGSLTPSVGQSKSPAHSRKSSLGLSLSDDAEPPSKSFQAELPDVNFDFDDSHWTLEPAVLVNGGLINAVRKSAQGKETDTVWIGTICEKEMDRVSNTQKEAIALELATNYNAQALYLSDADLEGHYEKFCKVILWPVLHYRMPDNLRGKAYEDNSWPEYLKVSRVFADKVIETYKPGDTIWVHDYHLMLVPAMIRESLPDARIGFFLHTSFPPPELLRCVSTRKQILEGLMGADLIGVQTEEYAKNILRSCSRFLQTEVSHDGVHFQDRFVRIVVEAIGIVHEALEEQREDGNDAFHVYLREVEDTYRNKILIVARDKQDSIRGLRQKLLAYELFLKGNPDLAPKVALLQIATSTTEMVEAQTSVRDIFQRIHDTYGAIDHVPIEFLPQDMHFASYMATISAADVLLITPLREGMGLTAHEYIYCQDGRHSSKKHGVVVLSEFAGSSPLLGGHDLPCNPWDLLGTSQQIHRAVTMSDEEKQRRWTSLRAIVENHTGGQWYAALQQHLYNAHDAGRKRAYTAPLCMPSLTQAWATATNRVLIIDHDAISPSKELISALAALPNTQLVILSAAAWPALDAMPSSTLLLAANGLSTRLPNKTWTHTAPIFPEELEHLLSSHAVKLDAALINDNGCNKVFDYTASIAERLLIEDLLSSLWDLDVRFTPLPAERKIIVHAKECLSAELQAMVKKAANAGGCIVAVGGRAKHAMDDIYALTDQVGGWAIASPGTGATAAGLAPDDKQHVQGVLLALSSGAEA